MTQICSSPTVEVIPSITLRLISLRYEKLHSCCKIFHLRSTWACWTINVVLERITKFYQVQWGIDSHVLRLQYGENYNWQQRLQCPVTWRTLQRKAELLRRCYLVVAKSKLYTIYKYVPKFLHLSISPNLSILLYEHVSLRLPSTVARVEQRLVCWYVFMYQPISIALNHW